jgi:hypothetical protein
LSRRTVAAVCAAVGLTVVLAAFSSFTTSNGLPPGGHPMPSMSPPGMPPMTSMPAGRHHPMPSMSASATPSMSSMPGMGAMDGLATEYNGYGMASGMAMLPAGKITDYRFTITGPNGMPITNFAVQQTQRLHFYAIRSDLTGFQHVHPTLGRDGTWTATLAALRPGTWQLYASFVPNTGPAKGQEFVLSRGVRVPGRAVATAVPAPSPSTTVDGYTVAVKGKLMANTAAPLMVTITKDGRPVTNLQPYLDTYAHLTAFHEGDLAFAHLHPETAVHGDHGGPALPFHAELSRAGNWRLFLQFQTSGVVHTAALTVHVR